MDKNLIKKLQEMPKTILHIHLDGSLRPKTVCEWLGKSEDNLNEISSQLMVNKNCKDLNQYLEKFDLPIKLLQTQEHIKRATYELYEDLAKQNVKYAQVRFAPAQHTQNGLKYNQIIDAAIEGMEKAKKNFNIDGNLILCCMRGNDNKIQNLETVKKAKEYLNIGVGGVDLAGAEALYPTMNFKEIFDLAKQLKIPITIHAGEAAGPESIKAALKMGATRIGHGIRCLEDKELVKELIKKEIVLEVCPTSNLQTKAAQEPHPIEELYKQGLKTTISTDNDTVSNTNIIEEYIYILENTNLTFEDLIQMNKNANDALKIHIIEN